MNGIFSLGRMDHQIKQLEEWGVHKIYINPKIKIKQCEGMGYGFIASQQIFPDEIICSASDFIHLKFDYHRLNILSTPLSALLDMSPIQLAVITLTIEKSNPNSLFRPYLDILLPAHNSPLFWNNEELSQIYNSSLADILDLEIIEIGYKKVNNILEKEGIKTSIEDYRNNYSIILSRGFQGPDNHPYLVPILDMVNSKIGNINVLAFHEDGKLLLRATKEIRQGEQIFNSYGDWPNHQKLR
eukprot:TRINITY_DN5249_c0_g1_i1.p1 TRINITY_DN5249_c0_g1~~TRINITY_DN5249_c0_g1_i1.p1  ORF type:complete len:242 (-),score=44.92 TRINITY_DN5249_c0_g1_i1:385-1110(-)